MIRFEFLSKGPDKNKVGIYNVMSYDAACKLEIIDLSKHPNNADKEPDALTYNVADGEGSGYHYKIKILDTLNPMTDEEKSNILEECWDWWLSYYLL